jgi:hypothetical protein
MDPITAGRIIHYVLANGEHRPAIAVAPSQFTGNESPSLVVFLNGPQDAGLYPVYSYGSVGAVLSGVLPGDVPACVWIPSAPHDEDNKWAYSWHWPERAEISEDTPER